MEHLQASSTSPSSGYGASQKPKRYVAPSRFTKTALASLISSLAERVDAIGDSPTYHRDALERLRSCLVGWKNEPDLPRFEPELDAAFAKLIAAYDQQGPRVKALVRLRWELEYYAHARRQAQPDAYINSRDGQWYVCAVFQGNTQMAERLGLLDGEEAARFVKRMERVMKAKISRLEVRDMFKLRRDRRAAVRKAN